MQNVYLAGALSASNIPRHDETKASGFNLVYTSPRKTVDEVVRLRLRHLQMRPHPTISQVYTLPSPIYSSTVPKLPSHWSMYSSCTSSVSAPVDITTSNISLLVSQVIQAADLPTS